VRAENVATLREPERVRGADGVRALPGGVEVERVDLNALGTG
jgi:hypothetical protein